MSIYSDVFASIFVVVVTFSSRFSLKFEQLKNVRYLANANSEEILKFAKFKTARVPQSLRIILITGDRSMLLSLRSIF